MGWIYFIGYLIGALVSARIFYVMGFESDWKDSEDQQWRASEEKWVESARKEGLFASVGGIIWPIVWIVLGLIMLITKPTPTERKLAAEKAAAIRERKIEAEMIRLRRWHTENKMDAPDTGTLRFMAEKNVDGK